MASTFLDLKIDKEQLGILRRLKMKLTGFRAAVLADVALFWHHQLLVSHFTPGAESRYGYEERTPDYIRAKRRIGVGQGRYVSNVLKGRSLRSMQSFFQITKTSHIATLRMQAPKYFTHPFTGVVRNAFGLVTITRQPDKPGEVTRVSERDMAQMRQYAGQRIAAMIAQEMASKIAA